MKENACIFDNLQYSIYSLQIRFNSVYTSVSMYIQLPYLTEYNNVFLPNLYGLKTTFIVLIQYLALIIEMPALLNILDKKYYKVRYKFLFLWIYRFNKIFFSSILRVSIRFCYSVSSQYLRHFTIPNQPSTLS